MRLFLNHLKLLKSNIEPNYSKFAQCINRFYRG